MKKTSIITVTNQKGGVGKTTTVCNLAAVYAGMDKKVLVVDLDHQGNSTMLLDVEKKSSETGKNIARAFNEDLTISDVVLQSPFKGIDVIAANGSLEDLKEKWNSHPKRFKLIDVLFDDKKLNSYDVVIIDTHPAFDCYLQSALVSSHYYLIPLFAEEFSIRGLGQMIRSVDSLKRYHNDTLNFLGCIVTKFDKTSRTHVEFETELRSVANSSGFRVFDNVIPLSKAVAGAEASHLPLMLYKPELPVSLAYSLLAGEISPLLTGKKTGRPKKQRLSPTVFRDDDSFEVGADL